VYILVGLLGLGLIFSFFGLVPYTPQSIVISTLVLVIISWATNTLFAYFFKAPTNIESVYITALILALIISPATTASEFIFLGWTGILSMASKYTLTIGKKHIFNPAAIALVITMFILGQSASWWVGTAVLAPFVFISGVLIIRKLHFGDLAWSFFTTCIVVSLGITFLKGGYIHNIKPADPSLISIIFGINHAHRTAYTSSNKKFANDIWSLSGIINSSPSEHSRYLF
jgi:hypothetical protein